MTADELDWSMKAIQLIRYSMAGDEANAGALIELAKSRGELEALLTYTAMASAQAFKVGFGPMAGPLLNAALKAAREVV